MPVPKKHNDKKASVSAKERVYNGIVQWIIDGTVSTGEKLNEVEIADFFSVSRTPVHEALLLLADQKMVDIIPSRGSYVSKMTLEEAASVFEAMSAINSYISRLACDKRSEEDLHTLEQMNDEAASALADKDYVRYLNADRRFHAYIAGIAGNPYLEQYSNHLYLLSYRYEFLLLNKKADRRNSIQQHTELINAIRNRDKSAAEALTENNFSGIYRDSLKELL